MAELRVVKAEGRAPERVQEGRLSFGSLARAMYLMRESKGWSGRRASRAKEALLASESISSLEKPIVASAFRMLLLRAKRRSLCGKYPSRSGEQKPLWEVESLLPGPRRN
jgi:hypothetical protein